MNNRFTNELENEFRFENENELEMNIGNETQAGNELEMNSTVEFTCKFHKETIRGCMDIEDADDETPLQFYDLNNQLTWQIPPNPNDKDLQFEWWADYDYLTQVFQENDIVQYLCDYADEEKTFVVLEKTKDNDVVILEIN